MTVIRSSSALHHQKCVSLPKHVLNSFSDEDRKLYDDIIARSREEMVSGQGDPSPKLKALYERARQNGWEQYCSIAQIGKIFGFIKS